MHTLRTLAGRLESCSLSAISGRKVGDMSPTPPFLQDLALKTMPYGGRLVAHLPARPSAKLAFTQAT